MVRAYPEPRAADRATRTVRDALPEGTTSRPHIETPHQVVVDHTGGVHVLAAPDKFKGTATAHEIASAICEAASRVGATCERVPMADGGEGTLDALGGANRSSRVVGPLGEPVTAEWRLDRGTAVVEMARASGLVLAGGAEANDPLHANTHGVGQLIGEAVDAGARSIIVGVGGSATTDGGLGALEALGSPSRLRGALILVACDVRTRFVDAAAVFGPQKGASPAQVSLLHRRLEQLADRYLDDYGVDVRELPRAGAAGGLAGGLAAFGAELIDGFEVIADELDLEARMEAADLVVTGEGFLDNESFEGKVVGGVAGMAESMGVAALAVAGQVFDDVGDRITSISLGGHFGLERAMSDPVGCVTEAVEQHLRAL